MKKVKIVLTALLLVIMYSVTFAQDSTLVHTIQSGIPILEGKWPFAAQIVGWCLILSEVMSLIPDKYVPANGIAHTIWIFFKAVFAPKKP
jgi:TRAP-type C4-dicarboxylate transport system permease small subunit